MEPADVVVIGAGAMGSATAYWLARDGRDVVLVEQFERGHDRGSSHGGTRIFRFAYADPIYVGMARAALDLWREVESVSGQTLVERTGAVDHGDPASVAATAHAMAVAGARHEILTPEAAVERWPGMRFDGDVIFHPDGGRCYADRAVRTFQDQAVANGADVHFGLGPARLEVHDAGGVTVRAGESEWRAGVAVVTAGAWVGRVLAGAGLGGGLPPLRTTQEQIQHFPFRPGHDDPAAWPSFIHHRPFWHYGLFAPGEGVKVAVHLGGTEVDPDHRPERDLTLERDIVDYVGRWLPGLEPTPGHRATCLYTITPTEDFVLDRAGPVVVGSPCSGHGFKFAPLIGRMLADLAQDRPPSPDLAARFALAGSA